MERISSTKLQAMKYSRLGRLLHDIIGLCEFLPFNYQQMADMVQAITGVPASVIGQFRVAQWVMTLFRLINLRVGLTAEDDKLPERFYQPKNGPEAGKLLNKALNRSEMERMKRLRFGGLRGGVYRRASRIRASLLFSCPGKSAL